MLPMTPQDEKSKEHQSISKVYDQIAESFDTKRKQPWEDVSEFIETIDENKLTLDLGCGNGRHTRILLEKKIDTIGMDVSFNILKTALENELYSVTPLLTGVINADVSDLSFKDKSFDRIIMIAVFHHLDNLQKRKQALQEIFRIMKSKGRLLISCWLRTHPRFAKEDLKTIIEQGEKDVLVPWTMPDKTKIMRYYYLFEKQEFEDLIKNANFRIISSRESKHNLFIIAEK